MSSTSLSCSVFFSLGMLWWTAVNLYSSCKLIVRKLYRFLYFGRKKFFFSVIKDFLSWHRILLPPVSCVVICSLSWVTTLNEWITMSLYWTKIVNCGSERGSWSVRGTFRETSVWWCVSFASEFIVGLYILAHLQNRTYLIGHTNKEEWDLRFLWLAEALDDDIAHENNKNNICAGRPCTKPSVWLLNDIKTQESANKRCKKKNSLRLMLTKRGSHVDPTQLCQGFCDLIRWRPRGWGTRFWWRIHSRARKIHLWRCSRTHYKCRLGGPRLEFDLHVFEGRLSHLCQNVWRRHQVSNSSPAQQ